MLRALLALLLLALPVPLRAEEPAPVTITGVVLEHENVWQFHPSEPWSTAFKLVAWRSGDGPVQSTQMEVSFTADTEDSVKALRAQLPERQVVRFTVVGDVTFDKNRPEATLLEVLPAAEDPALMAAAAAVLKPAPITDPELGTFLPAIRPHSVFSQDREWLGQPVEVVLFLDLRLADTRARTLAALAKAWDGRQRHDRRARKELQRFHDLWLEQYRRPGGPYLTRADFTKRLKLVEVSAFDNGDIGFRYLLDGVDDFPVMDFNIWNDGTIETNIP
ncbi:hypothetical protein [Erythrobacter oryzae]|uniref:hypothetical protein n=1 Tax=Erythrobacter oryzae TaxID=3019556 RepID=UPI0025521BE0|nr:hypothetical protein [Erythrobacter sp. COR-2]